MTQIRNRSGEAPSGKSARKSHLGKIAPEEPHSKQSHQSSPFEVFAPEEPLREHPNALIIANGTLPAASILRHLARSAGLIVCADGGANHARKMQITPDVILGDLDSILVSTKKFFNNIPLLRVKDQESTDLEKAIDFCIRHRVRSAGVVGATGDRIDHSTGNLGCFKKFRDRIDLQLYDSVGFLSLVRGTTNLKMKKGEKLSLIPLGRCHGVSTRNLKYPLRSEVLELGVREGTSNEATSSNVTVRVKRGTLLVYRFYGSSIYNLRRLKIHF